MFLAISWRKVVDVEFQAAIPEVVEVLFQAAVPEVAEVLDVDGVTVLVPFEAAIPEVQAVAPVAAVPEVAEVSHEEPYSYNLMNDQEADKVLNGLINGDGVTDWYELDANPNRQIVVAHKVRVKPGVRVPAPAQEVVELESNGIVIGSIEVDI
jgi:uncharacterized alkaline shock family protein YloU